MKLVAKPSKDYKKLKADKKVTFYQNNHDLMSATGSAFPSPPTAVSYAAGQSKITALKNAVQAALSKGKGTADAVIQAETAVEIIIDGWADYCDSIALGNVVTIAAAGFDPTVVDAGHTVITDTPVVTVADETAAGEAGLESNALGADVTYNFIVSTDLSSLKKLGDVFVNLSVGATTYFLSSRQKKIVLTGMPSLTKLYVACFTTNVAGNSGLSAIVPFSCK
jgi:hypothetical protein